VFQRRKKQPTVPQQLDSHQMESLRVFHAVARALTSNLELDPLLRTLMSQMEGFFGPDHWSLLLIDEERSELYYALSAGHIGTDVSHLRIPLGTGIAGQVASTGYALVIPDISADPDWSRYVAEHAELNLHSIACLPVRHGNRTLGVLQITNSKLDLLPESSMSFLRVLCDYTAIALENARRVQLIHDLSITDDCTGLFNARHLYTTLEQEIARTSDHGAVSIQPAPFSLLFFDLDHFKSVNDRHGHLVGSRLLAEVGSVLKRALGPSHSAFRYGGDEFVALLHGLDKPAATKLTEHLLEQLTGTIFLSGAGLSLSLTASFGLATFPQDGRNLHDLIRAADTMMYKAKADGRNRIAVADPSHPAAMPNPKVSRHS